MQYSAALNLALAAAGLFSTASGLVSMQVRYTDNMVNVGNLNAFQATWQKIYATDGSLQGVVTDDTYQTDKNPCQTDNKKDLSVQVTMDGSWGAAAGVNSADMRGAMVSTLWSSLITLWKQNEYVVYEGCYGTVWQNSPAYSATAACGPKSATSCATACSKVGTPKLTQCDTATFGSKVPSKIRVTAYEGDKLLAEELTVTFGATDNDISDGGCGLVGVVAKQLAGFVPGVGSLFAAGIDFKCAKA